MQKIITRRTKSRVTEAGPALGILGAGGGGERPQGPGKSQPRGAEPRVEASLEPLRAAEGEDEAPPPPPPRKTDTRPRTHRRRQRTHLTGPAAGVPHAGATTSPTGAGPGRHWRRPAGGEGKGGDGRPRREKSTGGRVREGLPARLRGAGGRLCGGKFENFH